MSEFATIFDAATACRYIFRTAIATPRLMHQEWAENRLADFNLWASSAGASTTGKASLDYRLRENLDAHTILINLLSMLRILVQRCISQASEIEDTAAELSSDEYASRKDVEENLNQLTRLAVVIRKAGTRSRLQKADTSFNLNDPRLILLSRHLEFLLLVRPDEHGGSDSSGQQLGLAQVTPIQQRLIDANLRRRNRFLYAQKHAKKLGGNFRPLKPTPIAMPPLVKQVPRPEASTSAYSAGVGETALGSTTTATMVDEPIVIPSKQQTATSTATAISVTTTQISYPKPPIIHNDQALFTCPCCCQSLPVAMGRGSHWKKHLTGDITPYTCILEECPQPELLYVTKESWSSHMDKTHGSTEQWVCQACSQKNISASFKEPVGFTAHLQQEHSRGIKPHQIPMLLSAWQRKVPVKISACPLCSFDSEDQNILLDHIAEHIHSFSLRSLPWPTTDGSGKTDEDEGLSYFGQHPYFDVDSAQSELSSSLSDMSLLDTKLEINSSSDAEEPTFARNNQQQQLTEDALEHLPNYTSRQANTSDWLGILNAQTDLADDKTAEHNESLGSDHFEPPNRRYLYPEKKAIPLDPDTWVRMEDISKCNDCGKSFNKRRPKYHCWICGNVFDSDCTATVSGQDYGLSDTEITRVCKRCENGFNFQANHTNPEASLDLNPASQRVTSRRDLGELLKRRLRLPDRKKDRKN
ncbi:hypothetical protein BJX65DRAFT_104514 [Aspergillus insuetus]